MYQKFDILGINASLKDKRIYIECSLDIDEATVTKGTITIVEQATNIIVDYDIVVENRVITLTFKDWPTPNVNYLLIVQAGIKSITDEPLNKALRRSISFPSGVTSAITILSPVDYEEVVDLRLLWKETPINSETPLANEYYIEVATENAFYNIVRSTVVYNKESILLSGIPQGQYYVRARAQSGEQYGKWSEIITFLFKLPSSAPEHHDNDDDVIYEQNISIARSPINGETPATFLIEFDEIIDPGSIESIIVLRRSI